MSNIINDKKKRPPKLKPINLDTMIDTFGQATLGSATSNEDNCNLDKTVLVSVENHKNILISPDSLTVLEQLGRGQYGEVEKVCHKTSGCLFAVKRVPLRQSDDLENRQLLMDVDILVKVTDCKNIIKFFGALIWEGELWVIMELMDCSLRKFYKLAHKKFITLDTELCNRNDRISQSVSCSSLNNELEATDQHNPIPEKVLGRMAADIVSALSYLYSIKVIHRDIKPSNILINRFGLIKLCDFGISGYLVNSVARTYEAGCRPYMAPERINPPRDSTGYDIKSDVWSFGITMLEIATGRYPYQEARGFFEQIKSICGDEPPRLPERRFSQTFEDFIGQCLQKDFHQRPKYDTLEAHGFIEMNKDYNISYFTEKTLRSCE